ncbi:MAG TPA: hypothetical protein VE442_03700 [Jatrophihabitans sp.]|jgi:hypothetical protein|nr:hypothetical protein [Jatrophihabitans sp.]
MDVRPGLLRDRWLLNRTVYEPGQQAGHYESFYQRANHPERPLAFWIRYTILAPAGDPDAAVGELWTVAFDGETGQHAAAKQVFPIADCDFARDRFAVRVGGAVLGPDGLTGAAGDLSWELTYTGDAAPVLLLPPKLYAGGFPKAKSLVALPLARFSGRYVVAGRAIDVDGWTGSQNHNWGSQHTHRYAFGQVAGFAGAPDTFLEIATAKARVAGPLVTPWATTAVLRHAGAEYSLVSLRQALRAKARYGYFHWDFATEADSVHISGRITAERDAFVALRYGNPPGGFKQCLNTKIATAELTVRHRGTGRTETLRAPSRALFEILTDDTAHGVPVAA